MLEGVFGGKKAEMDLGVAFMPICCSISDTWAEVMTPLLEESRTSKDSRMLRRRVCGMCEYWPVAMGMGAVKLARVVLGKLGRAAVGESREVGRLLLKMGARMVA